jgi:hypothetical protein
MTAKRYDVIDKEEPRGQSVTYDGIPCTARHCCTNLNRLTEENEQLKQILNELSNMLKFDVENGIRSYPVKLSEYLSNALKELQE